MTPDPIQPALTPDEWKAEAELDFPGASKILFFGFDNRLSKHAIAALALYQQPFGFTQEDVDWIRDRCDDVDDVRIHGESLAARIASLLPPSDSEAP